MGAASLGAVVGTVVYALPRWRGPVREAFSGVWPFSMYRFLWGTSFLLSVSALVEAGRPVGDALTLMEQQAKPWYRDKLRKVQDKMDRACERNGLLT